jgi:hypothetical protein
VECTRARDHLLVTGVNPVSEFLDDYSTTWIMVGLPQTNAASGKPTHPQMKNPGQVEDF